uniref:Uncharacterized protein n=1 Tax=Sus scrofa TaxID=9823 RepID=A0A8D1AW77_PIG
MLPNTAQTLSYLLKQNCWLIFFFFFLALLTVLVQCSCLHFRTIAKRALFYKDELVGPDELFLGTGCLAIHVRADELEFDYPVTLCGIEIQVFYDGTFINSWLTYKPRNHLLSAELRLECMVPRLLELNKKNSCVSPDKSTNDTERINSLIIPPPVQYWFLIQYRYCVRCGYAHFRDNWVRIPSKSNTYQDDPIPSSHKFLLTLWVFSLNSKDVT